MAINKNFRISLKVILACGLFLAGCAKAEGLLTLKRLGDSQEEIGRYLERQEKLFNRLVGDLKDKKLKPGVSKQRVINIYGEPVLSKKPEDSLETVFLYRHPTKYFSSEKVYLHFNESGKLSSWKYVPRKPPAD